MLLAAASARESLANARAAPRNMLRGNWSRVTTRASDASGVVCHPPSSPRAARSQVARKRRRISASNGSDFRNHDLRGRPRSRESGTPNQKSSTSTKSGALTQRLAVRGLLRSLRRGSATEAEVGEVDQHRGAEVGAQGEQHDRGEYAHPDRRQEFFPTRHVADPNPTAAILSH